jgi:hypothetical protein
MMSNTILSKEQKEALDKVLAYSMPQERTHLEECICDNAGGFGEPTNEDTMTDDELYALAKENSIDHIWVEFYHLSKVN